MNHHDKIEEWGLGSSSLQPALTVSCPVPAGDCQSRPDRQSPDKCSHAQSFIDKSKILLKNKYLRNFRTSINSVAI